MTDRGAPTADGSPACPFVAFEDDRDERGDRPDHRHRCFAEAEPAPRALAHQEAYCLSSAFPVCPTFQEWARREAAHAVHTEAVSGAGAADAAGAGAAAAGAAGADEAAMSAAGPEETEDLWGRSREEPPVEERPRRNPPRDWAAPPPWAAGAGAAAAGRRDGPPEDAAQPTRPSTPEGQGLAGSAADRLAQGGEPSDAWRRPSTSSRPAASDSPAAPADPELAGLVGESGGSWAQPEATVVPPTRPPARRPTVSSTRDQSRERERERERQRAVAEQASQHDGPSWEKQRRYEAYPSIKTRAGLSSFPAVPTVAILFGGVLLAAIALFFLPAILGVGGRDDPTASPTPSVAASTPSPSPTPVPEPTAQTYVIKSGDTLSAIAREFNVSLDALLAANEGRISNPNRIRVGDEIIIPLPETTEPPAGEESPAAS
jgi:hypothetical protein